MTDLAPRSLRESSAVGATLRHARYVISENPVTGVAFALFVLIVLAAVLGPSVVPYDPLASNTDAALKPPSVQHWFGTDQLGRDVFSRVVVAAQLDFFIAVTSVALVFVMGSPGSPPVSSAAGPTVSSGGLPTPSWRSRFSCLPWGSSRRSATRWRTSSSPPRS
jgi:hypothetical protein